MKHEFPRDMLALLRCSIEGGELSLVEETRASASGIAEGMLRCTTCAATYRISEGIARMMISSLTQEGQHEMDIRDSIDYECQNVGPFVPPPDGEWRSVLSDMLEIPPHMKELGVRREHTVLELACGDGRFTGLMAQAGARVMAVDFSINALRLQAHRVPPDSHIGRVHADINHFHVLERGFDRALSATPLHSRDERMTMYRRISNALKDDGRYICGVEYDDLNRRSLGLPLTRRYSQGGILIEHLTTDEMKREMSPYFRSVRMYPIRPKLLLVSKWPRKVAYAVLFTVSKLPWIRNLGEVLLVRAESPLRLNAEGAHRKGSPMAKSFYRWYLRRKNRQPMWGEEVFK
jgi:SAM-dependent methyltransferase